MSFGYKPPVVWVNLSDSCFFLPRANIALSLIKTDHLSSTFLRVFNITTHAAPHTLHHASIKRNKLPKRWESCVTFQPGVLRDSFRCLVAEFRF